MKKLFWCGVGVAVAAASCVYLASRHVENPPFALVGQMIMKLGGEEEAASGAGGASEAIPDDPEPTPVGVEGNTGPMQVVAVDMGQPGFIIVEDPECKPAEQLANMPQADLAAPPPPTLPTPPMVMPYCYDDVASSGTRMPYADEDDGTEEESEPVGDIWDLLRRIAAEANAAVNTEKLPVAPREVNDETTPDEATNSGDRCPEDEDYHRHHPTCPYTGRSYPLPAICPPAPETPPEENNNTPKYHKSMKPIGEEESGAEEQEYPYHKLDTMEFRPSDAGFEHFVPGPF
jgi:hypothetical protein